MKTTSAKFFKLYQALARRKDLTSSAKIVYAVIADHIGQNPDGYPGTRKLADETGLTRYTVMAAISRLEATGLLQVKRKNRTRNRYVLPSETGGKIQPDEDGELVQKNNQFGLLKDSNLDQKTDTKGRKIRPDLVQEFNRNQTDPLKPDNNSGTTVDGVIEELKKNSIREPMLSKLAKYPGITPGMVRRLAAKAKTAKNPAGLLVSMIQRGETGLPDQLTPETAAQLVNAGELDSICGFDLPAGCNAGYNCEGLYIFTDDSQAEQIAKFTPGQVRVGVIA